MNGDVDHLGSVRGELRRTLDTLVPQGSRVALLDFPAHTNVGDLAIWLGEIAYLNARGCTIAYSSDLTDLDLDVIRKDPSIDRILLHGGGNLGDVWPAHQLHREEVVKAFPHVPVVQLPQTIRFRDESLARRAGEALARHPDLTVLVRDKPSLEWATAQNVDAVLCPDSALLIDTLSPAPADHDVVYLRRTDHERRPLGGSQGVDWLGLESAGRGAAVASAVATGLYRTVRKVPGMRVGVGLRTYLAAAHVKRGVGLLQRGRVVVTDRLHAHLLCVLLGIPHVLWDDRYGKVRSYYEAWWPTLPTVRWVTTAEQEEVAVQAFLHRTSGGGSSG